MESWIIFALLSAVTSGTYSFIVKISAENHNNPTLISFYSFLTAFLLIVILIPFFNIDILSLSLMGIGLAVTNAITFYFGIKTRIISLKNIDSSIYFPIYKTLGPTLVLLISLFFFNDKLTIVEFIGIILGICVPLLLLSSNENKRQKNLKTGLIYLVLGTLCTVIAAWAAKYYITLGFGIFLYLILTQGIATIFGYTDLKVNKTKLAKKKYSLKNIYLLSFLLGGLNLITFYFYLRALTGNLAIVYTINSFSLLIPIILSIIIYKEHFNLRKAIAVVLSIAAILFFI